MKSAVTDKYWFDDKEYAQILDNLVIVCVDSLLYNKNRGVFLGKRKRLPLHDWWIFGGRMQAKETYVETAKRCLNKEVGLIPQNPLNLIGYFNLVWDRREEKDQKNGCHVLLVAMKCELSDLEAAKLKVLGSDHEKGRWFSWAEMKERAFHPYLNEVIKQADIIKPLD